MMLVVGKDVHDGGVEVVVLSGDGREKLCNCCCWC